MWRCVSTFPFSDEINKPHDDADATESNKHSRRCRYKISTVTTDSTAVHWTNIQGEIIFNMPLLDWFSQSLEKRCCCLLLTPLRAQSTNRWFFELDRIHTGRGILRRNIYNGRRAETRQICTLIEPRADWNANRDHPYWQCDQPLPIEELSKVTTDVRSSSSH